MYCRNCGRQLSDTEKFCPQCGTKVDGLDFKDAVSSVKRGAAQAAKAAQKAATNVKSSGYGGRVASAFDNLGKAKPMFIAVIALLGLNFFVTFANMLDYSFLFFGGSGSFLECLSDLNKYDSSEDIKTMIAIFTVARFAVLAAAVLTALPVVLGKSYKKVFLILNYLACIFSFSVYSYFTHSLKKSSDVDFIEIKFAVYLYLFINLVCIVCTVIFSIKLNSNDAAPLEAQNQNYVQASQNQVPQFNQPVYQTPTYTCERCARRLTQNEVCAFNDNYGNTHYYCQSCYYGTNN